MWVLHGRLGLGTQPHRGGDAAAEALYEATIYQVGIAAGSVLCSIWELKSTPALSRQNKAVFPGTKPQKGLWCGEVLALYSAVQCRHVLVYTMYGCRPRCSQGSDANDVRAPCGGR